VSGEFRNLIQVHQTRGAADSLAHVIRSHRNQFASDATVPS